MPQRPNPVDPNHRMDPSRNGDGRAIHPPENRNERPNRDAHGRDIPPNREQLGRIDRGDVRRRIEDEQNRWDRNNHGYDWRDINGMHVGHHYDEYGFHWWGFYVGGTYFWTRYVDGNYAWYDPYWHRWCTLHDGQWWWQDVNGDIYVYNNGVYYRYGQTGGGVIMTPDPTPPVEVPPSDPTAPTAPANQVTVYSLDGTRSVQIQGEGRDAYVYDVTVADPNDPRGAPRWLASDVAGAEFVNAAQVAPDGSTVETLGQIRLTYDDPASFSVVDPNGERKVDVSGDDKAATLSNLVDDSVDPLPLFVGVTGVTMNGQQIQDASGETIQKLQSITVNATDDAGNQTSITFDRDGAPALAGAARALPMSFVRPAPEQAKEAVQVRAIQRRSTGSAAFQALQSGMAGW